MPPYYGLWSRLEGFDPHELGRLLTDREAVRLTLWRATVHLVTVRDALRLRPLMGTVIERNHNGAFGRGWAASRGPAASSTLSRRWTRSSCAIWPPCGPASVMDVPNWSGLTKLKRSDFVTRQLPAPDGEPGTRPDNV